MSAEPERDDTAYQDPERCVGTPVPDRGRSGPVPPTDADAARARLAHVLAESPEGVNLPVLARRVFDRDEPTRADRQWCRRLAERQGHRVERPTATVAVRTATGSVENRDTAPDLTWIFPRSEPADAGSRADSRHRSGETLQRPSTAATNAGRSVARRPVVRRWQPLTDALTAKRLGSDERTRYDSVAEALRGADAVAEVFAGAAALGHRRGVVLTLTTDPSRYDSVLDAAADLYADAAAARGWIGRNADRDGRPRGVTVAEPTSTGIPHVHVAAFGVDPGAIDRTALGNYWRNSRGRGYQVHVAPIRRDRGTRGPLSWTWTGDRPRSRSIGEPEHDGCPPAAYLAAGSRSLATVASRSTDALRSGDVDRAERDQQSDRRSDDVPEQSLRTASWFLATDLPTTNGGSPSLRSAAPRASATDLLQPSSPEPVASVPPRPGSPRAPRQAAPLAIGPPRACDRPPPKPALPRRTTGRCASR